MKQTFYTKIKMEKGSPKIVVPKKVFQRMGLREDQTLLVTLDLKRRLTWKEKIERSEEIVKLRDEEGMGFEDIAKRLGYSLTHVKRLYRWAEDYKQSAPLGPAHISINEILGGDTCYRLYSAMGKEFHSSKVTLDELMEYLKSKKDWRSELLDIEGIGAATVKQIEDIAEKYGYEL